MKILTTERVREWERVTLLKQSINEETLLNRTAMAFCRELKKRYAPLPVVLVVGPGGNGADGLFIAKALLQNGMQVKKIYLAEPEARHAPMNFLLQQQLKDLITPVRYVSDVPVFEHDVLIIDALFGSGANRRVIGVNGELIEAMNQSKATLISVDLPSGLSGEEVFEGGNVVKANLVITFATPKLSFFLPESEPYFVEYCLLETGLDRQFFLDEPSVFYTIDEPTIHYLEKRMTQKRSSYMEKWEAGFAGIMAGSMGIMGASVLASKACLRSGAGLLMVQSPACGLEILQISVPEAMVILDRNPKALQKPYLNLQKIQSLGVGPGIGRDALALDFLKALSKKIMKDAPDIPLVIDADAIRLIPKLSEKTAQAFLRKGTILTPQRKEFEALLGSSASSLERLQKQSRYAITHGCILLHKGKHTSVALPDGRIFFNLTGNEGMATAGSGDVLTGVLTGLLAQGYSEESATLLGVYVHGLAGDLAEMSLGKRSITASSLIDYLPQAFLKVSVESHFNP